GWKLHVSAGVSSAGNVLQHALPVLLTEKVCFKVIASVPMLGQLNGGAGSLSQVGKFITIYPTTDTQAVRLSAALDGATRGLRGPLILSDRPLTPGSLVHYRYGSFGGRRLQTPLGELVQAVIAPDGTLIPDRRSPTYSAPPWAADPFVAAGISPEPEEQNPLIADRFLTTFKLHDSPRGAVYLAMDIAEGMRCVLKQARRDATMDRDGSDARDRLRHEASILSRVAPDARFPMAYELIEWRDDLFLAMEDLEGETLEKYVLKLRSQGRFVPTGQALVWGRELAAALQACHDKGIIYRDLKSSNVLLSPDKGVRLIDFEIAYDQASGSAMPARGTRGYNPLEQSRGELPGPADDIHGLGAVLYYVATGAEPTLAPHPFDLLRRSPRLLNPSIGHPLEEIIARCLHKDPAARFASMEEVISAIDTALLSTAETTDASILPFGGETPQPEMEARSRSRELAQQLTTTLCHSARLTPDGSAKIWASAHPSGSEGHRHDINTGGSGAVLALAELVSVLGGEEATHLLATAAHWLAGRTTPHTLPGLYVGESGVGAAILRAGQVLGDAELIASAEDRGRSIARLPYTSPDLFHGTAGRLRFHLLLWDQTAHEDHLEAATRAGDTLLDTATHTEDDGLCWAIPPGYGGLSGATQLGYAHGAAGIADALLDLFEATHDHRFLTAAESAGHWLQRQAVPSPADSGGLCWPVSHGGHPTSPFWCHGAVGIGLFFLHAALLDAIPGAAEVAAGAARSAARAARWAGAIQCHGLAGNIEFLLDMFQATRDPAYLTEARSLARLLEAFAIEREGMLLWPSEGPAVFTPDYMVGYAGVATCLLRLSDPESLPHLLSRRGFQRRSATARTQAH
ncbi:MAG: class IV lanthionine synthetase LanL, partial [Armatimonadota bacterium]|nr:class IV lanthionine synthetase LanL [Armatimonadota bacterium]